jgi:tRNA nucleotidyltransferase/poly(A) polymerase
VRFIGDAEERIKEDYLRILRFFRVHAYYGKGRLDEDGLHATVKLRAGLELLSAERVGAELKRLLVAPGAVGAVEALYDYGLLSSLLGGVPLLQRFERLVAIEAALGRGPNAALRLAALAVFIEEDVARLSDRLRLSNAEAAVLMLAARIAPDSSPPSEASAKELLYRLGVEAFRSYLLLAFAASGAAPGNAEWRCLYSLPERWQAPSFPLRGADLAALGLKGPDIGETLRRLEQEWIAADFRLPRETLLARARELAACS